MQHFGDKEQILAMIRNHEKIIYKICNTWCTNKNDREDLAQEIIYQILKSGNTYKKEFKFSTWMYRVALNVAISHHRASKKSVVVTEEIEHESIAMEDFQDSNQNLSLLHQFLNELKDLDKALMLLYLESKSYNEISEILGISETNVATKINRIKKVLKQKFSAVNT